MAAKMSRKDAQSRLIRKAWKNEDFYRQLLENPKDAIEKELGLKFADDAKIVVHQESANRIHVVLPVPPEMMPEDPEVAGQSMSYHLSPECDDPLLTEPSPFCTND